MRLIASFNGRAAFVLGLLICALAFAASAQAENYVALGDSYASGVGSGGTVLNSSCDRRKSAYPYLISTARADNLTFAACSGATTTDVMNNQISSVTANTNVVTVQIGGNDIGFASMIVNCTLGNCVSQLSNVQNTIKTTLPAKLDTVYSGIKARAPLAKVIVVGYPDPAQGKTCLSALGISSAESAGITTTAGVLRDTIKATATAEGFTFADAIPSFTGHGVCASSPWLNGFALSSSAYHPNANGHKLGFTPLVGGLF